MRLKKEIDLLYEYVTGKGTEKSTDFLVFPLFRKLFSNKFSKETDAQGADIYINGQLVIELKTKKEDWLPAFYQALDYGRRGITFSAVSVITHNFIGLWRLENIPEFALELIENADTNQPPSQIGAINARNTKKYQEQEIIGSGFCINESDLKGLFAANEKLPLYEYVDALNNLNSVRQQINPQNFIRKIEVLKGIIGDPLEAIHCFYTIIKFWDITSIVPEPQISKPSVLVVARNGGRKQSESIIVNPNKQKEFRDFIQSHYVFTNEGSGLTVDYYFSRFDEVISVLKPEYVKQLGIYFTSQDLSNFTAWFANKYYGNKLKEDYIILDPAGGSGNLVTSWRKHVRHKIVSEIEPDLLKIIERRMKADSEQVEIGFTIVPKTVLNKGLNFLDKLATCYLSEIQDGLSELNLDLNKPIAFLLNPPYKNTDENEEFRKALNADYEIDESIVKLAGKDAVRERYLAFLAQIVNIAIFQVKHHPEFEPIIMVFTPTSWLIPRPAYKGFREIFDTYFKFERGFIINGNEFFKIGGKFPISFTIWRYNEKTEGNTNNIRVYDYTSIEANDLIINWSGKKKDVNHLLGELIKDNNTVNLSKNRGDIRKELPELENFSNGKSRPQPRYDYSHAKKKNDYDKIVSGFPIGDRTNHLLLKRKCGCVDGPFIGFYDDNTPVRVLQDRYDRMSDIPDRVWFRLDSDFKSSNKARLLNGPPDNRAYCAYDIDSSRALFTWFAITKAFNYNYPLWANQFDIWGPNIADRRAAYFYSLCFAFGLAENRCVVTKFEADNPVKGAPEVFVDNPLCPSNPKSFWSKTLKPQIVKGHNPANNLIKSVGVLYKHWGKVVCKGSRIEYVGLDQEPYFKYFDYPDFVVPFSGLTQIKRFSEINRVDEISEYLGVIRENTKDVLNDIHTLLVDEFDYFG